MWMIDANYISEGALFKLSENHKSIYIGSPKFMAVQEFKINVFTQHFWDSHLWEVNACLSLGLPKSSYMVQRTCSYIVRCEWWSLTMSGAGSVCLFWGGGGSLGGGNHGFLTQGDELYCHWHRVALSFPPVHTPHGGHMHDNESAVICGRCVRWGAVTQITGVRGGASPLVPCEGCVHVGG